MGMLTTLCFKRQNISMERRAGSHWDGAHGSPYNAVHCVLVARTELPLFWLLWAATRLSVLTHPTKQAGGAQEARIGLNRANWIKLTRVMSCTMWHCPKTDARRRCKESFCGYGICPPKQQLHVLRPCFQESSRTSAYNSKVMNRSCFPPVHRIHFPY